MKHIHVQNDNSSCTPAVDSFTVDWYSDILFRRWTMNCKISLNWIDTHHCLPLPRYTHLHRNLWPKISRNPQWDTYIRNECQKWIMIKWYWTRNNTADISYEFHFLTYRRKIVNVTTNGVEIFMAQKRRNQSQLQEVWTIKFFSFSRMTEQRKTQINARLKPSMNT